MKYSGYTIKDLAELLDVSKTTVSRAMKDIDVSYDYIEKNRQMFNYETAVNIISYINKNFDFSKIETPQQENHNTATKSQRKRNTSQQKPQQTATTQQEIKEIAKSQQQIISILENTIKSLESQLSEKDRQINNLTQLLFAEQVNNGKVIAELTQEHQQQENKKKGLFSRLFSRNT